MARQGDPFGGETVADERPHAGTLLITQIRMFDELTGHHSSDTPTGAGSARKQRILDAPSSGAKTTSDLTRPQRLVSQSSQARNFWINHALPLCVYRQYLYRYCVTILKDFQRECCRRNADLLAGNELWDYVA